MGKQILYIGRDNASTRLLQTTLEARGYEVVLTSDPGEAAELLRTRMTHAVCIDSPILHGAGGERIGEGLKFAGPHTPVVLIEKSGPSLPPHFAKQADAVMDETSFLNFGHRRIEELREAKFPILVQWLEEWKQRSAA